jgi:hypothetical protein
MIMKESTCVPCSNQALSYAPSMRACDEIQVREINYNFYMYSKQ